MIRLRVVAGAVLLLAAGSGPAFGQEEDELSLLFSKTEVTTVTKQAPEPAALAPADVTVITGEEIRLSGARDLSDVLRTVVGIELQRDQFGAVQIVSRGLISPSESNYILLLLDGVPANIPYYGGASLVWDDLDLTSVKRIEVIRGPGSALYGASAFAGVIQVFTRTGEDHPGELVIGGGSFPAGHAGLSWGTTIKDLGSLAVRADVLDSDGPPVWVWADSFTGTLNPQGQNISPAPGYLSTGDKKVHLSVNARMGDTTLTASFLYKQQGDWVGNYVIVSPLNHYDEVDGYARLGWGKSYLDDRLNVQLSLTEQQHNEFEYQQVFPQAQFNDGNGKIDDFRAYPAVDIGNLASNSFGADAQASWNFARHNTLLAGFSYQDVTQYDTYFYDNWTLNGLVHGFVPDPPEPFNTAVSRQIVGGFVNEDWTVLSDLPWVHRLRVLVGGRYDFYADNVFLKEAFGNGPQFSAISPRAGLVWELFPGYYAKYLYGRAFRPASFRELYSNDVGTVVGEDNLKPELVDFNEFSLGLARPKVQVQVTGYLGHASELIGSQNVGTEIVFGNIGSAQTNGVEGEVRVDALPRLHLFANATLESVTSGGQDSPGVSHQKGTLGASGDPFPWLSAYGSASYLGGREIPGVTPLRNVPAYTWVTLSATLKLPSYTRADLQLTCQQALNQRIVDPFDGPALPGGIPGEDRSYWAQARWRW